MRNGSLETQSAARVAAAVPGASTTLRSYGIDPTSRLPLWQAASAAATTSDEVLAVIEARMRRQALRAKKQARMHEEVHEHEAELVA